MTLESKLRYCNQRITPNPASSPVMAVSIYALVVGQFKNN
jgi:hypothetical protein